MPHADDEFIVLYRGDTRPPAEIFTTGFIARNKESEINFGRVHFSGNRLDDINPENAVCLTTRIDVAPLFPLAVLNGSQRELPKTYIYAVRVKISSLFLSYTHQLAEKSSLTFAQEVAIKQIAPEDVLYGISVTDRFYNFNSSAFQHWTGGGFYCLDMKQLHINPQLSSFHQNELQIQLQLLTARERKAIQFAVDNNVKNALWSTSDQLTPAKTITHKKYQRYKKLTEALIIIMESQFINFQADKARVKLTNLAIKKKELNKKIPYYDAKNYGNFELISFQEILLRQKSKNHYKNVVQSFIDENIAYYANDANDILNSKVTPSSSVAITISPKQKDLSSLAFHKAQSNGVGLLTATTSLTIDQGVALAQPDLLNAAEPIPISNDEQNNSSSLSSCPTVDIDTAPPTSHEGTKSIVNKAQTRAERTVQQAEKNFLRELKNLQTAVDALAIEEPRPAARLSSSSSFMLFKQHRARKAAIDEANQVLIELYKQLPCTENGERLQSPPDEALLAKLAVVCSHIAQGLHFVAGKGMPFLGNLFDAPSNNWGTVHQVNYDMNVHQSNMKHLSQIASSLEGSGWKKLSNALFALAGLMMIAAGILAAIPTGGAGLILGLSGAAILTGGIGFFVGRDTNLAAAVSNVQMKVLF